MNKRGRVILILIFFFLILILPDTISASLNITLIAPLNASNYTASDNVTFIFNVTGTNDDIVANCSLIINNGGINRTNSTPITKDENQTFYYNLTNNLDIPYNWTINCTNGSNVINTTTSYQVYVDGRNLTICNNLTTSNVTYYLTQDINLETGVPRCIDIGSNNITLDCNNYVLNFTNVGVGFISGLRKNNTKIENCIILGSSSCEIYINVSKQINIINNTLKSASIDLVGINDSMIINNTITGNTYCGILLESSSNNILENNNISANSGGGICISSTSRNNTIINLTQTTGVDYDINISNSEIIIKDSYIRNYSFSVATVTIEDTNKSKITYDYAITQNGTNLSADINLQSNLVSVNSTQSGLNQSAEIILYNLSFNNPRILRDGGVCLSSICTEITYNSSNGTFIFNVTNFSSYSAEDYCGNGYCESGESCSSCPADCGACGTGGNGGGGGGVAAATTEEENITEVIESIEEIEEIEEEEEKGGGTPIIEEIKKIRWQVWIIIGILTLVISYIVYGVSKQSKSKIKFHKK
jgi:parallel beta-helix repeat protein